MTSAGRRRDRRVYRASHPLLFALLPLLRRRPVRRLGSVVLINSEAGLRDALTRVPLDRRAAGTLGGVAATLAAQGILFDQDGSQHRGARRGLVDGLGAAGVQRLRPVWTEVLGRRLAPLACGGRVDLVDVVREFAGATVVALLRIEGGGDLGGTSIDPHRLAAVSAAVARAAVRSELPRLRGPGARRHDLAALARATAQLNASLSSGAAPAAELSLAAMLAITAVNTTVATIPRAAAWCADDLLWPWVDAQRDRSDLIDELLRVIVPVPVMSRVAAADGEVSGCPVHSGDRMVILARHALAAHRGEPDPSRATRSEQAQLVFGVGTHACPGARLARTQLADTLAALAPHRPRVVRARADRRSALPGWAELVLTAGGSA